MKVLILQASPRPQGNTASLVQYFRKFMEEAGHSCREFSLYSMDIKPCTACRGCQQDWEAPSCVREDDMHQIFDAALDSDLIVFASPIYSCYCTPPMKSAMDRLVYAMNKYYGDEIGPSIWQGKTLASITTCGYPVNKGADLWEEGLKRYCKHSKLKYLGMLAERHANYKHRFINEEKIQHTREFAESLISGAAELSE